ncbi:2643_t:CDS:2 [Entrophospora sp. SA101]|nr:15243_t:CDS:2 [Entrophospora sp. SA101]CAJ0757960.1 2643_t:CDS:2 [Entrophospora sp. SA101]
MNGSYKKTIATVDLLITQLRAYEAYEYLDDIDAPKLWWNSYKQDYNHLRKAQEMAKLHSYYVAGGIEKFNYSEENMEDNLFIETVNKYIRELDSIKEANNIKD